MRTKLVLAGIVLAGMVAASLAYLLPVAGQQVAWMAQSRAAVGILIGSLSFGAAWWFFSALPSFTKNLRIAYRLVVAGVVLFGLGLLQLPVIGILNIWNSWYVFWGIILVPFLVAVSLLYVGLRAFGRILAVRSRFMSWRMLTVAGVAFIAIFVPLSHFLTRFPAEGLEVYDAVLMWCLAVFLFCAGLAFRIQQTIGEVYKDAMRWMGIVMIAYAVATFHEYLVNIIFDPNGPYAATGAELFIFVVAGFLFLEAGRRFYLLVTPAVITAMLEFSPEKMTDNDYIESIVRIAELVSRPQDIDSILDDLRMVTATHGPGLENSLSTQERERLAGTYRQIESYLATKEPVRRLSPQEIRGHVTPVFRAFLAQQK